MFSLVTGKYRHAKRYGDGKLPICQCFSRLTYHQKEPELVKNVDSSQSLIQRSQESALSRMTDNAAGKRANYDPGL